MNGVYTDRIDRKEMSTWHDNGPFPIEMMYRAQQDGNESYGLHHDSMIEIQKLLKECVDEGKRFRAIGSRWSLNDIAFNGSRLHANSNLDLRFEIKADQVHPMNGPIRHDNLIFTQGGATVNQLGSFLEKRNKSLKTCGGSCGQTIAGAISTGVHGGALERQSMSDYVRGIQLVVGPKEGDIVYLERASFKVLNDDFITNSLKSSIIRDDNLFNGALSGLGSFGFIGGLVLEVEDIYSLKRYIREIDYDDAMNLLETLDFKNSNFKIEEEIDSNGHPITPYHFKPYINQYTKKKCVAEVLYKIPYQRTVRPEFDMNKHLHPDIFRMMHWAMEKSEGKIIEIIANLLQGTAFPNPKKETEPIVGTLRDIFHPVDFQEPGFSWAYAVGQNDIVKAMKVFCRIFEKHKVPGLTAIKLVQQTDATLGFTRFPMSAVIGLDGIQWQPSGSLLPREAIEKKIVQAFISAKIEFTHHWGKNTDWGYPSLVGIMYGDAKKNEWIEQRSRLIRPELSEVFSNDFLQRTGLSTYNHDTPIV